MWLVNSDDIKMMYQRVLNGGPVTLWCDGRAEKYPEEGLGKRKRDSDCAKRKNKMLNLLLKNYKKNMVKSRTIHDCDCGQE